MIIEDQITAKVLLVLLPSLILVVSIGNIIFLLCALAHQKLLGKLGPLFNVKMYYLILLFLQTTLVIYFLLSVWTCGVLPCLQVFSLLVCLFTICTPFVLFSRSAMIDILWNCWVPMSSTSSTTTNCASALTRAAVKKASVEILVPSSYDYQPLYDVEIALVLWVKAARISLVQVLVLLLLTLGLGKFLRCMLSVSNFPKLKVTLIILVNSDYWLLSE